VVGDICKEGVLTLVDLAGSEHRIDSMYHSAERRKEGAAINSSLMALKDCIRAKASGKDISHYYRKSKLTMALKASFFDPEARTVVIVTVSPASKDTEHSLNSLRHACIMDGQQDDAEGKETRFMTGGKTTVEKIGEINVSGIAKKNLANKASGKEVDLKTSNGNTFGSNTGEEDKPLTEKEKLRMRRASERAAIAALTVPQRGLLKRSREALGTNRRQQMRLRLQRILPTSNEGAVDDSAALSSRPSSSSNVMPTERKSNTKWELVEKQHFNPSLSPSNGQNKPPGAVLRKPISPIEDLRSPRSHPPSNAKVEVKANSGRRAVNKLRIVIYGRDDADDGVPGDIKRRQFSALLKQNGYTKEEVDSIIMQEIEKESRTQQVQGGRSEPMTRADPSRAGARFETMSAGHIRAPVEQEQQSIVKQVPLSRHEAAKLRREQKEADDLQKKLNKKVLIAAPPSAIEEVNHAAAIAELEVELLDTTITTATRHGIMKRIANHKSVLVREERWKEQEKREAEKNLKNMKLAAAAEEAKRRLNLQSTSQAPSNDRAELHTESRVSSRGSHRDIEALRGPPPVMTNTQHIESYLSPRDQYQSSKPLRPNPSPVQTIPLVNTHQRMERREQHYESSPPTQQSRGRQRLELNAPGERSDSLDRIIENIDGPKREPEVYNQSSQSRQNLEYVPPRRGRFQQAGAASAPFANDMNWNST
jgi:hypothetical protein